MPTLKLTAERQATFPKETCEALGIGPGDMLKLEARNEGRKKVWIIRPRPVRTRRWVGCLGSSAKNVTSHSLQAVRKSISTGRRGEA